MNNQLTAVQQIKFNNRNISYRRIGTGKRKILFFHGFPGSSVQIEPFLEYIQDFDLEVLCFDRPGYHFSDATQGTQFDQTTAVCKQIVESFGWLSCELIAVSGGTPFLFSFLENHPQFISRVHVVCGLGPILTTGFEKIMSWKVKLALRILPLIPGGIFAKIFPKNEAESNSPRFEILNYFLPPSPADAKTIQNPRNQNILRQAVLEAVNQNGKGPKLDAESFLAQWKINVTEYQGPIDFWHGDDDHVVPLAMARQMHKQAERSELTILNGQGHYSIAFNFLEPILAKGFSKNNGKTK